MRHRRALRRRYGRAVRSRISLVDYQGTLAESLRRLGYSPTLHTSEERLLELHGWQDGKKPLTVATAIARARNVKSRGGR